MVMQEHGALAEDNWLRVGVNTVRSMARRPRPRLRDGDAPSTSVVITWALVGPAMVVGAAGGVWASGGNLFAWLYAGFAVLVAGFFVAGFVVYLRRPTHRPSPLR